MRAGRIGMKLLGIIFVVLATLSQLTIQYNLRYTPGDNCLGRAGNYKQKKNATYTYQIKRFEVPVDHFSFSKNDTFQIRYLVNDTWSQGTNPPIFFYTGNEGYIEVFAENTGFMWEIATEFHALLIFAEHRFYGSSMPYGNTSFTDPRHLGYLTSQQALADYIDLIQYLRLQPRYKNSPVIAFGGSYGGMLSAWIRMKYPHIVQGAIAASAPILQFTGVTACQAFARIVTSDFRAAHPDCPIVIRNSWSAITNVTATAEGKKWLSDNWKLCQPLKNATDVKKFKAYLEDVYGNLAMVNYPYAADFLAPLPANPISATCKHLTNSSLTHKSLLLAVQKAINVFTNFTGKLNCLQTDDAAANLGANGWNYQACTEMVMPMCTDGVNDMFEPEPWDIKKYTNDCQKMFSAKPRPYMVCEQYGCADLSTVTNVIFSNGLMDPWSSGGVLQNLSSSAIAILIPEGAHHIDLRSSNINDPYSVVLTRKYHRSYIGKWIKQYRHQQRRVLTV